jgi:hypothetical protein
MVVTFVCLLLIAPIYLIERKVEGELTDLREENQKLKKKVGVQKSMMVNPYWKPSNMTGEYEGWEDVRSEFCSKFMEYDNSI